MAADTAIEPTTVKSPAERKVGAENRVQCILEAAGGRAAAMAALRQAVLLADWDTLGYSSVPEYLEKKGIAAAFAEAAEREGTELPELVAELRNAGLSQKQAGAALGITQARVSQLERGRTGNESRDGKSGGEGSHLPTGKNISQSPDTVADQGKDEAVTYIPGEPGDVEPPPVPVGEPSSSSAVEADSSDVQTPAVADQTPKTEETDPEPVPCAGCLERDGRLARWKDEAMQWGNRIEQENAELKATVERLQQDYEELEKKNKDLAEANEYYREQGTGEPSWAVPS
jgi:hypothetical protein